MVESKLNNFRVQMKVLREALRNRDWIFYTLGIIFMITQAQFRLLQPWIIGTFIDNVIEGRDPTNLTILALAVLAAAIISGVAGFYNRYFNEKAAERTIFHLRNRVFSQIQEQSIEYYNTQNTGQLLTRGTSDLEIIKQYLARDFRFGLNALYYFLSIGITIYILQPQFIDVFFVLFPFLLVISWIYGKKVRPIFIEARNSASEISNQIQEDIAAIETIRAFGQEKREKVSFDSSNKAYLNLTVKAQVIQGLSLPIAALIISIAGATIFLIGGGEIIGGSTDITVGQLVQFNLYMIELITPTRLLGNFIVGYNQTNVSGRRVFDILDDELSISEAQDAVFPKNFQGRIELKSVSFSYEPGIDVLHNLSWKIEPGSVVAVLGATGSGKSTLINLLPRFYDVTSGELLIDSINIKKLKLEQLRKNIGVVSQETFLFSRSIRENISFGKPEATDDEIIKAAKTANAHEFIMEFEDGYGTIVGERGVTLSGGQQQRLTIARTLLVNPKILIFDDSTSSVDATTEAQIQEALEQLMENRTTIIITQKVSSLRKAEEIIVLGQGEILEKGNHNSLIKKDGFYNKIYNSQQDPELEKEFNIILGGNNQ
jgi:ATP-binding cassette, subfamily B, multidrug efflux pump